MKRSLANYDTLPCPRCDLSVKPLELAPKNAVRYFHECADGNHHGWTINEDGDIVNELTT